MRILLAIVLGLCAPLTAYSQAMTDGRGFLADFTEPEAFTSANSDEDDYAPTYDHLNKRVVYTSEESGYAAQYFVNSETKERILIDGTFNREGHHRAFVSFGSGDEAVGVAFVLAERQSVPTIITVPIDNGSLNEGHPIDCFAGEHFTSQPSLSPDGNSLVVVSDREGGEGGLDLWVCTRQSDRVWSEPVQLSSTVNSEGDEITPVFISADSLVYASDGYGGQGGFDLFLVVLRDGAWQEPEPLTMFNSEFDESDLVLLPDGTVIFASNRPGGKGKLDLWVSRRR